MTLESPYYEHVTAGMKFFRNPHDSENGYFLHIGSEQYTIPSRTTEDLGGRRNTPAGFLEMIDAMNPALCHRLRPMVLTAQDAFIQLRQKEEIDFQAFLKSESVG